MIVSTVVEVTLFPQNALLHTVHKPGIEISRKFSYKKTNSRNKVIKHAYFGWFSHFCTDNLPFARFVFFYCCKESGTLIITSTSRSNVGSSVLLPHPQQTRHNAYPVTSTKRIRFLNATFKKYVFKCINSESQLIPSHNTKF